jgi:hypothetical protein
MRFFKNHFPLEPGSRLATNQFIGGPLSFSKNRRHRQTETGGVASWDHIECM